MFSQMGHVYHATAMKTHQEKHINYPQKVE